MKKLLILFTMTMSVFFIGCDLGNSNKFEEPNKRDILTANNWYYIDNNADDYTIVKFTDNRVLQDFYTDSSFREIAYTKTYNVDYAGDKIYLTDEYGKHTCKYNSCQNNEWMVITCDADQPYVKGWKTRALASEKSAK